MTTIVKMKYRVVRAMFCTAMAAVCLGLLSISPDTRANNDPVVIGDVLREEIDAIRREAEVTAVTYLITSPQETLTAEWLGTTSLEGETAFTRDHFIRIGSITKTLLGLLTLRLVESGTLDIDTPIENYLEKPPYDNPWREYVQVTIAQLLEHTSGLRDLSPREFAFNRPIKTIEALEVDPSSRKLGWRPGDFSSYSNSGAGVVTAALEQVTGERIQTLFKREVFEPLGMVSATLSSEMDGHPQLITGYDSDGKTPIAYWHTLYPAFGATTLRAEDMLPVLRLFLNRGIADSTPFLPTAAMHRAERPATSLAARNGLDFGYGLGLYQFQRQGVSFFGHGGDADGYLSYLAYSHRLQRAYFVSINAFKNRTLRRIRAAIEKHLLKNVMSVNPPTPARLSQAELNDIVGDYTTVTTRFKGGETRRITITAQTVGELTVRSGKRKTRLVPVTARHFRKPHETVPTSTFILCRDQTYYIDDSDNYRKLGVADNDAQCDE